jgi:hypothetical protein
MVFLRRVAKKKKVVDEMKKNLALALFSFFSEWKREINQKEIYYEQ